MDTKIYASNPDRLLVEIGFAGAQYGLIQPVADLASHLGNQENTKAASILILGVLSIAMKDYDGAVKIFKSVQDNPSYSKFSDTAKNFESIANQVSKK
jgi:hypothetical protein